jgi:hypothetical protein
MGRFSRRQHDASIESDCMGPPEVDSVEIRHISMWRTETGSGFCGPFVTSAT